MEKAILFLRPFWDADTTAQQLKIIYRITRRYGKLIAIRNSAEQTVLRLTGNEAHQISHNTFFGKLYSFINPPLNLELIAATDDTWQEHAIEQIHKVDVVIVHLAPRKGPNFQDFPKLQPNPALMKDLDFAHDPVYETGTGQGLLRELDYCKQVNALDKVIVLIPISFYPRVQEALAALEKTKVGQWFRHSQSGFLGLTPKLSALDQALAVLSEVRFVIPYRMFGGPMFNYHLHQALISCLVPLQRLHDWTPLSQTTVGIPSDPVALPPDGRLKRIRFTRIQSLTKIPAGEIVELSLDEVKTINSDVEQEPLQCPSCGRGAKYMFWYQYGLEPNLSLRIGAFMRCQYC